MFTGIVQDIGEVRAAQVSETGMKADVFTRRDSGSIDLGASIACDGVCLTVTHVEAEGAGAVFSVDISPETLHVTNLSAWQAGRALNIESAMKIGDEIGGHIVSGHVDGLALIEAIEVIGENWEIWLDAPADLAKFIASKGSVTMNGTSLTVNAVDGTRFKVNVIPHTLEVTSWGQAKLGDAVNLEVDMMARYVARLREFE